MSPPRTHSPNRLPDFDSDAIRLVRSPILLEALAYLERTDDETMGRQRELTEIPAPPFLESERGGRMADLLREVGVRDVTTDQVGNVWGQMGPEGSRPTVVSAHLDTVFPAGTDVKVRVVGDRLCGPGITDDGRGLAALLALARVITHLGLELPVPTFFLASVGEEGLGNLRGVRHFLRADGPASDARGFVSLDGAGSSRIVNRGVGSARTRITVNGPGGHSWSEWGNPNPIHAIGRLVGLLDGILDGIRVAGSPDTTLSANQWGGGESVNAIPPSAWAVVEIRSRSDRRLAELDETVQRMAQEVVADGNSKRKRGSPEMVVQFESLGRRPAGETSPDSPLVLAAAAVTRALGHEAILVASSTDANLPMALGIPAITMGAGGLGGQAHSQDEWYKNTEGPSGIIRALATLLLFGAS